MITEVRFIVVYFYAYSVRILHIEKASMIFNRQR